MRNKPSHTSRGATASRKKTEDLLAQTREVDFEAILNTTGGFPFAPDGRGNIIKTKSTVPGYPVNAGI